MRTHNEPQHDDNGDPHEEHSKLRAFRFPEQPPKEAAKAAAREVLREREAYGKRRAHEKQESAWRRRRALADGAREATEASALVQYFTELRDEGLLASLSIADVRRMDLHFHLTDPDVLEHLRARSEEVQALSDYLDTHTVRTVTPRQERAFEERVIDRADPFVDNPFFQKRRGKEMVEADANKRTLADHRRLRAGVTAARLATDMGSFLAVLDARLGAGARKLTHFERSELKAHMEMLLSESPTWDAPTLESAQLFLKWESVLKNADHRTYAIITEPAHFKHEASPTPAAQKSTKPPTVWENVMALVWGKKM